MNKDKDNTPSSLIFSTARKVSEDMVEMVDDMSDDLVDYMRVLEAMASAMRESKINLERHVLPITPQRSKERKRLRKKISAINEAICTCMRLKKAVELTLDDVSDIVKPGGWDSKTRNFLADIMEPSDEELGRIDDDPDMPPETFGA